MRHHIINTTYLILIFFATLGISTLALTRKVNSYKSDSSLMSFVVDKDDIQIANSVVGKISKIYIQPGQHVNEGDILAELSDESQDARLQTLERIGSDNLSAYTQAQLLKAQQAEYQIKAPRSGVVYQLLAAEGTYLPINTTLMTLFADNDVRLLTRLSESELERIQRVQSLDVYSPRLEQTYKINYRGVGVVKDTTSTNNNLYEAIFTFDGAGVGVEFIEGETLEVIGVSQDAAKRPADFFVDLWNQLLIGN